MENEFEKMESKEPNLIPLEKNLQTHLPRVALASR